MIGPDFRVLDVLRKGQMLVHALHRATVTSAAPRLHNLRSLCAKQRSRYDFASINDFNQSSEEILTSGSFSKPRSSYASFPWQRPG